MYRLFNFCEMGNQKLCWGMINGRWMRVGLSSPPVYLIHFPPFSPSNNLPVAKGPELCGKFRDPFYIQCPLFKFFLIISIFLRYATKEFEGVYCRVDKKREIGWRLRRDDELEEWMVDRLNCFGWVASTVHLLSILNGRWSLRFWTWSLPKLF